jgi:hypothetical protein
MRLSPQLCYRDEGAQGLGLQDMVHHQPPAGGSLGHLAPRFTANSA